MSDIFGGVWTPTPPFSNHPSSSAADIICKWSLHKWNLAHTLHGQRIMVTNFTKKYSRNQAYFFQQTCWSQQRKLVVSLCYPIFFLLYTRSYPCFPPNVLQNVPIRAKQCNKKCINIKTAFVQIFILPQGNNFCTRTMPVHP